MKRSHVLVLLLAAAVVGAFGLNAAAKQERNRVVIDLRDTLTFEYAVTPQEQTLGLGGRSSLAPNAGMLFVFGAASSETFWMKGMRFPLDIVWIDQGTVVDVATLQPPRDGDLLPQWHVPSHQADRVLEVNAGTAKELGIARGARVILPN